MKQEKPVFIGIDAGSVSLSYVELNDKGEINDSRTLVHRGKIRETLHGLLTDIRTKHTAGIGVTTSGLAFSPRIQVLDPQVCVIRAARQTYPRMGSLLVVGGEKFSLTLFDKNGKYRRTRTNTSCAAGTGGFLDQQARRLELAGAEELSRMAGANTGEAPRIASRCSVFAKTDIIHAQQEGYTREEICDGLCAGMADNLIDTLFPDNDYLSPVVFAGGVALNQGVVRHLEKKLGESLLIHPDPAALGAQGAALLMLDQAGGTEPYPVEELLLKFETLEQDRAYAFPPLELRLSDYPDFSGVYHIDYRPLVVTESPRIETDLYENLSEGENVSVYLGVDIGSTSTKAMLIRENGRVTAGFYTRTSGRPIIAFQGILEALNHLEQKTGAQFIIKGTASTGSGRKFLGSLIGADCILDEISAHARAAYELDPQIDTIIEIGGQDSKFTTMKQGMVTFSQMNTVCAAGTGSFIEEQAAQLGVSLADYAAKAQGARAPKASDRCTVFMERDIHHYLNRNYQVEEILAAVLYSVRENYLQKVASTGNIGKKVCFQGATAKNKALVAAFEEKLKQPLFVSPYCHLTGAMGAALTVREELTGPSAFRGKDIYLAPISVRQERCELCGNHCRLRIAVVGTETSAFGFLCGRDYNTAKYVKTDREPDLLDVRKALAKTVFPPTRTSRFDSGEKVIGLPTALQITQELELWKTFFSELSIPFVTSEELKNPVSRGKRLAGAEFCTPIHSLYGHAGYLAKKCDVLFLPLYLEASEETGPSQDEKIRKYCYYTQFAPTLISMIHNIENDVTIMRPMVQNTKNRNKTIRDLLVSLNRNLNRKYTLPQVEKAYKKALDLDNEYRKKLLSSFVPENSPDDIRVVLLGRPYTILDNRLNNGIPGILAKNRIKTLYMDQIPPAEHEEIELKELLEAFHWTYASKILQATLSCARTKGLYPILITSFKCAPDSFLIEYYKRLLNRYEKPYLILQLDDHDSSVGYETRIEAGIRAFRNHLNQKKPGIPFPGTGENNYSPRLITDLKNKTIFLPNWDPMAIPLIAASLRTLGYDTRVLEETDDSIRESMSMNTGQCIPVNVIAHEYMNALQKENLRPEKTALWMVKCQWACNIHLYPYFIKSLLEGQGGGMENANIYWGDFSYIEFSPVMSIKAYFAYLLSGLLRRLGCALRPYEINPGEVDERIIRSQEVLLDAFSRDAGYLEAAKKMYGLFDTVQLEKDPRPKVAIFGDMYIRDNPVINQNLVHSIEKAGGEAVITPYSDYVKIIAGTYFDRWFKEKRYGDFLKFKGMLTVMELLEKRLQKPFEPLLGKPMTVSGSIIQELEAFSVQVEQEGESMENLLKIVQLIKDNPDIRLLVQANPAFCCPSLVTEAMSRRIEEITGIPIVTLTYDGTGAPKNDVITPYLKFAVLSK